MIQLMMSDTDEHQRQEQDLRHGQSLHACKYELSRTGTCVCCAGGVVTRDVVADDLVSKEAVVHPGLGRTALGTPKSPAQHSDSALQVIVAEEYGYRS